MIAMEYYLTESGWNEEKCLNLLFAYNNKYTTKGTTGYFSLNGVTVIIPNT